MFTYKKIGTKFVLFGPGMKRLSSAKLKTPRQALQALKKYREAYIKENLPGILRDTSAVAEDLDVLTDTHEDLGPLSTSETDTLSNIRAEMASEPELQLEPTDDALDLPKTTPTVKRKSLSKSKATKGTKKIH